MTFDLMVLERLRSREQDLVEVQGLPPGFEENVTTLIAELRAKMNVAPGYQAKDKCHDEIKSIVDSFNTLMTLRQSKIISAAETNTPINRNLLLGFEWSLYDEIRRAVVEHHKFILETVDRAYGGVIV